MMSGDLWYPAFKLKEDPFQYADRATEQEYGTKYELVRTKGVETTKIMAISGVSHIVVGPKGCGKSTLIDLLGRDLKEDCPELVTSVSCTRAFYELYQRVYEDGINADDLFELMEDSDPIYFGWDTWAFRPPNKFGKDISGAPKPVPPPFWICSHKQCPRGNRCNILPTDSRVTLVEDEKRERERWSNDLLKILNSTPKRVNCPLMQELVIKLCGLKSKMYDGQQIFLLDVPDNLVEMTLRYFTEFIIELKRATKCVVVLMATREQYAKMRKSEEFLRWRVIEFPIIEEEGLLKIIEARIRSCSIDEPILPFKENALEYLIKISRGNPRTLIQSCSQVMTEMLRQEIKEPVGLEFVTDTFEGVKRIVSMSDMDMILDVIEGQVGWRKVKWVKAQIEERFGLDINSARLGRMIKSMGYQQRANPDSEYRFG